MALGYGVNVTGDPFSFSQTEIAAAALSDCSGGYFHNAAISCGRNYFNDELIEVNLVLSLVPSPLTTAMIASEMPAAIRPYSMAVAPDSSARNARMIFFVIEPKTLNTDELPVRHLIIWSESHG
jgi:hypothetical protein